jgi:hypothetical protein
MPKSTKQFVVTVADEALGNIDSVAKKLAAKGMKVSRVLPVTGVITGAYSPDKASDLVKVAGVMSVEEEVAAQLPPPDAAVQ